VWRTSCVPSTSVLLQQLLRRSLLGQVLPPLFEAVAAAQAAGIISAEQARVIVTTLDKIPAARQAEHEARVEAELVEFAATLDPGRLAQAVDGSLTTSTPTATSSPSRPR
jgi:uncharacterized membrane protein